MPYLLQHHFLQNLGWHVVPVSLRPLVTELESFARGAMEAFRSNGDIVERQLFRSSIAILLFSENRFDRFMVMLNPIRSYSTLLKAAQPDEIADTSTGQIQQAGARHPAKAAEIVQAAPNGDPTRPRHWLAEIDSKSLQFRLDGLASKWATNAVDGWTYVYRQAHDYFNQHPHNPVDQCIADILDRKKHPAIAKFAWLPSDDTLKKALSRERPKAYQEYRQHLEGKIDLTDFGHQDQIPLGI
ncbi:hypothetical protein [Sphingorhabdus sp.]|uniref:hypothetical protein n=1 Tax=Sphingorhabdus sp. TaxID=1902408 RepID=UPI0025FCAB51|nr:hypothetical protein [Sphingorhabdus sp.]